MDEQQNQNTDGTPTDAPHAPPEMQTDAPAPMAESTPTMETVAGPEGNKKSFGPIFGIIIIVILLVLAGFYFWGSSLNEEIVEDGLVDILDNDDDVSETVPAESEETTNSETTGTDIVDIGAPLTESDEIETLEAELDDTELDEIDAELDAIDEELTF